MSNCKTCKKFVKNRCKTGIDGFNYGLCNWYKPKVSTAQYWSDFLKSIPNAVVNFLNDLIFKRLQKNKTYICQHTPLTIYNVDEVLLKIVEIGDTSLLNKIVIEKIVVFKPEDTYHKRLIRFLDNKLKNKEK